MEKLDLRKYVVSEKNYLEHVNNELSRIVEDGRIAIIALCSKLANYADPFYKAPVFVYHAGNEISNQHVLDWTNSFAEVKYVLPELKVKYLVALMTEENFQKLLNQGAEDADLQAVIDKYKEAIAYSEKVAAA